MTRAKRNSEATEGQYLPAESERPTPRQMKLVTPDDIRREMAAVYREARRGQIASYDASRFVYILGELRKVCETAELMQRIQSLEALQQPLE